jgi:formate dehydrogenase accessory protein FdhE
MIATFGPRPPMPALAKKESVATAFERRAARAHELAPLTESARDPLLFASILFRAQGEMALALEEAHRLSPFTGRLDEDVDRLLPLHLRLLHAAADKGPEQLAVAARMRRDEDPATSRTRLLVFWAGDIDARQDYLARALLRPYAELLRAHGITPDRLHSRGHCPFCGGAAGLSTRTQLPDSEGGLRNLQCTLCGNEWNFNRGCCPSCFEEMPDKLPLFKSDAYPNVLIEACDTCHRYLKAIDLSKDARPIAEVDDLLSLAMDLWCVDEGYTRIEPGLAGI